MKNCAFTIVAKNYIGLAQILESSIRKYYNDLSFLIIVADEVPEELKKELPQNVLIAKECLRILDEVWDDMSFKYDLTEFCTSLKPASFLYLFNEYGFEKVVYLDPDIYFYNSIGLVFEMLEKCSILLTPHITQISERGLSDSSENTWFSCGMYNLGFCGLHRSFSVDRMLNWWHERLLDNCYIDNYNFLFTDQKWIDFLPSFFSSKDLNISLHLGMNVAPWNFYERKVFEENGGLYVAARYNSGEKFPLLFVHYSGYDYRQLKKGCISQKNISGIRNYADVKILMSLYAQAIQSKSDIFDRFISLQYSYNTYHNGQTITSVHRRLYRALVAKGHFYYHPFDVSQKSFYELLKKRGILVTSVINIDKMNKQNVPNVKNKLRRINLFFKMVYRILGYDRYFMMMRLLRPFSRYESQIYLLDDKYLTNNIY